MTNDDSGYFSSKQRKTIYLTFSISHADSNTPLDRKTWDLSLKRSHFVDLAAVRNLR